MPIIAAAMFAFGYALQLGLLNRYISRPDHEQFLILLAISILLTSGMLISFGPTRATSRWTMPMKSYQLGPLLLDKVRVLNATIALAAMTVLWCFFRFARTGKAIRACADNQIGAQVVGLNVRRLYAITFGIGAACVGTAGCLMLLLVDVQPYIATDYTLLAFIIVILGGLGDAGSAHRGPARRRIGGALRLPHCAVSEECSFSLLLW